jgi:hypothetical protein
MTPVWKNRYKRAGEEEILTIGFIVYNNSTHNANEWRVAI